MQNRPTSHASYHKRYLAARGACFGFFPSIQFLPDQLSKHHLAMPDSLMTSFLAALQASLSVLLVIGYGVIAAQFDILKSNSTKQISTLCVQLFLPALLITNVGGQLHADTAIHYLPILIWGIFYILLSMGLGLLLTRIFKLPSWVTPALCFNNTTSLPLLLFESLAATGILERLITGESDSQDAAITRARSYFLLNSVVSNSLTFALGPKLLDGEEPPEQQEETQQHPNGDVQLDRAHDAEQGCPQSSSQPYQQDSDPTHSSANRESGEPHEQTALLPDFLVRQGQRAKQVGYDKGKEHWVHVHPWARKILQFSYSFLNAPLIGAFIGALLGLVPPLHRVFFDEPQEGGIFTAWLTDSVEKIGQLFAALQVVVTGVKLSSSLRKMKRGEESGRVPLLPTLLVLLVRFVVWPASVLFSFTCCSSCHWRFQAGVVHSFLHLQDRPLTICDRLASRFPSSICLQLEQLGYLKIQCYGSL